MNSYREIFTSKNYVLIALALFSIFGIWTARAYAQPQAHEKHAPTEVRLRAENGRASRPCGSLSVKLRFPNATNLRIMATSTYQATITLMTDAGVVLMECRKTTKTCYASWRRRDMKRGQNAITAAAVGSKNCSMSISSYVDVP